MGKSVLIVRLASLLTSSNGLRAFVARCELLSPSSRLFGCDFLILMSGLIRRMSGQNSR